MNKTKQVWDFYIHTESEFNRSATSSRCLQSVKEETTAQAMKTAKYLSELFGGFVRVSYPHNLRTMCEYDNGVLKTHQNPDLVTA